MKDVLVVALPMLLSMSFDTLMTFIDRLFLSKLGPAEMNAALGAGAVQLTLTMFFTGAISYTTAMVAQRLGAKRHGECAGVFMQALYVSLVCVPLLYLTIPVGHWLFGIENLPADQLEYQKTYFNILMFGGVITLVRNVAPCFFTLRSNLPKCSCRNRCRNLRRVTRWITVCPKRSLRMARTGYLSVFRRQRLLPARLLRCCTIKRRRTKARKCLLRRKNMIIVMVISGITRKSVL